jgi:stearoyl-CoA desaturase (Delta-9 desaturase)
MLSPHGPPDRTVPADDDPTDDIVYPCTGPFLQVHLACLAALWTGVTVEALYCGSSRSGRGNIAASLTAPTKPAGWFSFCSPSWPRPRPSAGCSGRRPNVHSPRQHGFLYAHVGWIFTPRHGASDDDAMADLARFRQLVWRDRPPSTCRRPCWAAGVAHRRLAGLGRRLLLEHGAALACDPRDQLGGSRRGAPALRNRRRLAQQLVPRDPHHGRETVIRGEQPLGRKVVENVARQLAGAFPVEPVAARTHETLAQMPI